MTDHDRQVVTTHFRLNRIDHLVKMEVAQSLGRVRTQIARVSCMKRPGGRHAIIAPLAEIGGPFLPADRILKHAMDKY